MNCLEFRRLLLANPYGKTSEQREHAAACADCARLVAETEQLEARIQEAALVPVLEGLPHRILLHANARRTRHFPGLALAATVLIVLGWWLYPTHETTQQQVITATAASEGKMAATAISFVLDHEPRLLSENRQGDLAVLHQVLARLGLKLPEGNVQVRYLGQCPVPGGIGQHVVLEAPWGHVTLILVPDQKLGTRVVVAERAMTAIAAPAKTGGYILISSSLQNAKRVEDLIL